jgi:hypothetical protein
MKNIVFFGDSFAAYGLDATAYSQAPTRNTNLTSYVDIVAQAQQAHPIYMGFSGASWWYSYKQLQQWISVNKKPWHDTQAVVMCLTDEGRPKVSTTKDFKLFDRDRSLRKSHCNVQAFINEFDEWAYRCFLKEVVQLFRGKKVILLPCFPSVTWLSREMYRYFATSTVSLASIAHSEFVASDTIRNFDDIVKYLSRHGDSRANHLSHHNNQALAQDIIEKLNNYTPGAFMLNIPSYQRGNDFFQHEYDAAQTMYQQLTVNRLDSRQAISYNKQ